MGTPVLYFNSVVFMCRRYLPPETQVVLVSATLPHDVLEMTSKFMTDPVRVLVKRDELTLEVGFDRRESSFTFPCCFGSWDPAPQDQTC